MKAPKTFRVWFRGGKVNQDAVVGAVRAWVADQQQRGNTVDAAAAGSTQFEVQPSPQSLFPGMSDFQVQQMESEVSFDAQARMQLMMAKEDADKLFVDGDVAIYPEW